MEGLFTKAVDILYKAKQNGVDIILNDGRLQLKFPEDRSIDDILLNDIRANKQLIIDFLSNNNWQLSNINSNYNNIPSFDRKVIYDIPLSFSQERLWFIDKLEGSVAYNGPVILRLQGILNNEILEKALRGIISRHEILRTVYKEHNGYVYQHVKELIDWKLSFINASSYQQDAAQLKSVTENLINQPFDLSKDYMLRAALVKLSNNEYLLVVTMHHIASDAWSMSIIVSEVVELYNSFDKGVESSLSPLNLQYADYAVWQRNYLKGETLQTKATYWKNKLWDVAPLALPTDYPRPAVLSSRGSYVNFNIKKEQLSALNSLNREHGATLYMGLLTIFKILLHRYTGQEDIAVGTSIANRPKRELESLVGFFVNTLTLRDEVYNDATFTDLLHAVRTTTLEAYEHQDMPFEKVVETVIKERDASRSPLFQVMLVLQNTPEISKLQLGQVKISGEQSAADISKFEITLFAVENPDGLRIDINYATDLYSEETIIRMALHFTRLVDSVIEFPNQKIGLLPMLSDIEEQALIVDFNTKTAVYPPGENVIKLFESRVKIATAQTALVFEDRFLSYHDLNEQSNRLAHYLRSRGVKDGEMVLLYIERGAAMIVGILGILKAGCAYVPVDTDLPEERISYILEDTGAKMIVTSGISRSQLSFAEDTAMVELDSDEMMLSLYPATNLKTNITADGLAYVIYTSGSTGQPKGVMITHGNLCDYFYGLEEKLDIGSLRSFALVSTIATDLGNTVIYGALLTGAALHVFTKEQVSNSNYLINYLETKDIDCVKIVPSHWKALSAAGQLLLPRKLIIFGGEALQSSIIEAIFATGASCQIVNHYGPTETTIGKLLHKVDPAYAYQHTIPIGKPFSDTQAYILDRNLRLSGIGIPGQLYISGKGLSAGYVHNELLTDEKFISNPFSTTGELMYATGDLVKYLPDGNIMFIGRTDDQVKIRGYRVELGEIERVINQNELVEQGIVLAREDNTGNKRLVAYIVSKEYFDKDAITKYLKEHLAEYMVPAIILSLENLPLTANGKIDRKALPDPDISELLSGQYVAANTDIEIKLVQIWQDILELDEVGIHDDFFELGGHSLLAVRLISMIRKELAVEIPIGDIFEYPTIAALATRIKLNSSALLLPAIVAATRPSEIPLSYSQERLWFIDHLEGSKQYHVPSVLRLTGDIDTAALNYALKTVVDRHEILRTVYETRDGRAFQSVKEKGKFALSITEVRAEDQEATKLKNIISELIGHAFNLSKDSMLRADLLVLSPNESVLVMTLHHIASDGWSASIMVGELVSLYTSFKTKQGSLLPLLEIQYADYALWQRKHLSGDLLDKKIAYWKQKLNGVSPIQLPSDHARPAVSGNHGASVDFELDSVLSIQLDKLSKKEGVTLFMTLLAAFEVLLYRYSGQEDICVGTPIAGRQQKEVEGLIGFFVNTLALRSKVSAEMTFNEFLKDIKKTTLEAYENQDVPFEKVVDAVVKTRDVSRSPLFQVMFILQNTPDIPEIDIGGLSLTGESFDRTTTKFDLSLFLTATINGLRGNIEYSTELYEAQTIGQMAAHLKELLQSIILHPEEKISRLKILSTAESKQLLTTFNATSNWYPKGENLGGLFEQQVKDTPTGTAVVFEDEGLSYAELNEQSNQLAHYLQKKGVGTETLVPICIERGLEMVIGILGVLKAGGAYVPMDPEYPADRIAYMLEDTGAKLVLSSKASRDKVSSNTITIITLDGEADQHEIQKETKENLNETITPEQLAYVIYTSGSTGLPKGVLVEHAGVVNLTYSQAQDLGLNAGTKLLQFASFGFDASCNEIFSTLLSGGTLVVCTKEELLSAEGFKALADKHQLSVAILPPSYQRTIKTMPASLQTIVSAGEALNAETALYLQSQGVRVINAYGPTENTVCATQSDDPVKEGYVTIGKPIANTRIYILDNAQQLVPVGVTGEMYIGGVQVARGYLNRPELTLEKFIKDPFSEEPNARLYRTGDLGRWLSDGDIAYQGRIDDQVKVRGYRIELGEIESVLQQSGLINLAVVLAKEDNNGNNRLISYVVPKAVTRFDKQAVQAYLQSKLPEYMVPQQWVTMDELPITANGKIDRKGLPDPEYTDLTLEEYQPPRNATEQALAGLWRELLGIEQVGINDNFFELGGDSILTIQLVSRIRRLGYELQPKDIFINQTVAQLSQLISLDSGSRILGEQGQLSGSFGLLPIQEWYLEKDPVDISHFNQSILLQIDKNISAEVLQAALDQLVLQHDALRLQYHKVAGAWQQAYGAIQLQVDIDDLKDENTNSFADQLTAFAEGYQRSLSITNGLLMRMVLLLTPDSEGANRLLIVVHHLVVDGVSWRILLEDLNLLISGLMKGEQVSLGVKGSSYRQWHGALVDYSESRGLKAQTRYWEQTVAGYQSLPVDKTFNESVTVKDINHYTVRLDAEQTNQLLHHIPKVYHTEINDLLLSAFSAALCEWSGHEEVVIGLEGHGRENISAEIDSSQTVGWFTSLYPVLLKRNTDIGKLIKGVKEDLNKIPDKGIGYGVLKYIKKATALQGNDPWAVVFNYLGQVSNGIKDNVWFKGANEDSGLSTSENQAYGSKLTANSRISKGELVTSWSYSSKHYNTGTISKLAANYTKQLMLIIAHCQDKGKWGSIATPSDYGLSAEITYSELDSFLDEPFATTKRKDAIESLYRLSGLQQGMLFHGLYDDRSTGYIEQFSCNLWDLNLDALLKSWAMLLKNHSILRSGFYYDAFSIPVQCVYKEVKLPVEELDYREADETTQIQRVKEYEVASRSKGFDFKSPPLMRIGLLRLSENNYRMVWTSHHILFDGWSMPILMEEFLNTYELLIAGQIVPSVAEDRYEDYIRYLEQRDKNAEEQYWKDYLQEINQGTLLPMIKTTAELTKGIGKYQTIASTLKQNVSSRIQKYVKSNHITVNTLVQGVWAWMLHKYTGNSNIIYGTVVSGRPAELPGVEQRVGMYINTLPLKAKINESQDIKIWLQDLQSEQFASRHYQYSALQDVKQWTNIKGDLFDTVLVFENYPVADVISSKTWSLKVTDINVQEQTNYPLAIAISNANEINLKFSYNTELLDEAYVAALQDQFEYVLLQFTGGGAKNLSDIRLLTKTQENILTEFNATAAEQESVSIIELFERQAAESPNAVALVYEDQELSYRELNERANQLARYLQGQGVTAETLVPLCLERGMEMIIGILGIQKAGGAYVPIDPEFPQDRIAYMLEDTQAGIVLTSARSEAKIPGSNIIKVRLDTDREKISGHATTDLAIKPLPEQAAYVIYTSGSTGRPKGVVVEHGNVVNLILYQTSFFDIKRDERILQFSNYCFDASVEQIYLALFNGASLIMFPEGLQLNNELFEDFLIKSKVSHVHATPAFLESSTFKNYEDLKRVIAGGDVCRKELVDRWDNKLNFYNEYGPTETTVTAIECLFNGKDNSGAPPIGKPVANTQVYILDNEKHPLPIGVFGELYIGGVQVARGYLNLPELTAEKFIADPYIDKPGARLYKTGDLARWLPDGNIEYLGRIDDQVKIRGYRIELGEIESVLLQSGMVRQAVILAQEDNIGNKQLVGYVVPQDTFNKQSIQNYLNSQLPGYMVPGLWVELNNLPLTSNGKVDKKALSDTNHSILTAQQFVAPRDEMEEMLAEIWQALLGVELIGIYDNFFDLGGHSLSAMRLVSAVRRQLEWELAIKDVFTHPTIAELSAYLKAGSTEALLPAVERNESYPEKIPLSFSQERLWFIDCLEGSLQYHISAVLKLRGNIDTEALAHALTTIIDRHEILRTVYADDEGEAFQRIKATDGWKLLITEHLSDKKDNDGLKQFINQLIQKPFDLSSDYMLRAGLIKINPDEHILVFTIHHIASDGWSKSILVRELAELYNAYTEGKIADMQAMALQYADYAIWQRKYVQGELLDNKLGYWKRKLSGVTSLKLPTDYIRPAFQSIRGAAHPFIVKKETADQLYAYSHQQESTLYMTLLAAFKVLLYRYSAQDDICVGTPIAGRQQQETEDMIGFFVNTLVLRSSLDGSISFNRLLQLVKETTLEAYDNQEVPFEKIVEAVVKERDLSRSPLFQVMFAFQNIPDVPELRLGEVKLSTEDYGNKTSLFDLSLNIKESPLGLLGTLEYSTDLFKEGTIDRFVGHYQQLLEAIIANPEIEIAKLSLLNEQETDMLLNDFNNTAVAYPEDKTVAGLFETQAMLTPNALALVFEDQELSYGALNAKSNSLARYLQSRGVKRESLVPIFIERGINMIVAILGVLKAGAAYVPIDPDYPSDRINYMLEDTGAKLIVSSTESKAKLHVNKLLIIDIDDDEHLIDKEGTENLLVKQRMADLAYVIYTSGSTGKPKGVMIEHKGLLNYTLGFKNYFSISGNDNIILQSSISFDTMCEELYPALITGASIFIIKEGGKDIDTIKYYIENRDITILTTTPTVIEWLNREGLTNNKLRYIISGGEVLSPKYIDNLYPAIKVVNGYGPSEATIAATYNYVDEIANTSLIGKPVDNTQIYILNNERQLNPIGVAGEIFIGGAQIARGYLNRPELTLAKFISNPFSNKPGAKMYSTGDLGRWLADGSIEYLGRIDDQVKIRGYRIELGEVESVLENSTLVNQAVVLAKEDNNGNKLLIGYVVSGDSFEKDAIISHLKTQLPDYMIPALWVKLDSLPLTPNGKIDKKALPEPDYEDVSAYVAARNETEQSLITIWQDLLQTGQIGVNDNFFELGGHSLLAMRIVSAIRKELKVVLSIKDLFIYPTIAGLAAYLKENNKSLSNSLIPIKVLGNKTPLYIVCGVGGTVFTFREFANMLAADQPVYGLQQPADMENIENFPETIEEIAAKYIQEILLQNPDGPYALAGHCLGGTIAFEMAGQLKKMGKEVSLLAMLDTMISEKKNNIKPSIGNLYLLPRFFKRSFSKTLIKIKFELFLIKKHPKQAFWYKLNKVKLIVGNNGNADNESFNEFDKMSIKFQKATYSYQIKPYDGDMLLFYAKDHYYFMDRRNNVVYGKLSYSNEIWDAWKNYAKSVKMYEVDGEHSDMFDSKYAENFAKTLQNHLNKNNTKR